MQTLQSFIQFLRHVTKKDLRRALSAFSKKEFAVFIAIALSAFFSMLVLVSRVNNHFMVKVPVDGGTVTEGIIGTPSLLNPVLALTEADKDLTSLIYSGLMRKMPDGSFVPDLAESYTVSSDGMVYSFTIKDSATFHDGTKVTADDVIFTISKIQDPLIKSPKKLNWDGITAYAKDEKTVEFKLSQVYISFLNNTTVGILPRHLWQDTTTTEFPFSPNNIKAIGSGPYKIKKVSKNADGLPEKYELERFDAFALGRPHIKKFTVVSYANENEVLEALQSHAIDQAGGISPENAKSIIEEGYTINTSTLPRVFGMFFNITKNKALQNPIVIKAINIALDRQLITNEVLGGYGTAIDNPVPSTFVANNESSTVFDMETAKNLLEKAGYTADADGIRSHGSTSTKKITKKVGGKTITQTITTPNKEPRTRLAFSLTTGDTPELRHASTIIKERLALIGIEVNIDKVYGTGELNQIIRSRDYEALFFGQVINNEQDLYAFWHSSQVKDPGLNIALYSNKNADTLLEQAGKTLSYEARTKIYRDFIRQFKTDTPAILIYSPKYLYAQKATASKNQISKLTTPQDRFSQVYASYVAVDNVWKIFAR